MTLPKTGGPELTVGEKPPETKVNEMLRYVDQGAGHFSVIDRNLTAPPGSPGQGDCYIPAATATGDWAGEEGNLAFYMNTEWKIITPIAGFLARIVDEKVLLCFDGTDWKNTGMKPGGSTGQAQVKNSGADFDYDWADVAASGGGGSGDTVVADFPRLVVQHQEASGTDGGTATASIWNARALTEDSNDIPNASIAAGQIILPAGSYRVMGYGDAYDCNGHQARLRNLTDGATELVGTSGYTAGADAVQTSSVIAGTFTLTDTKTLELQHYVATTKATFGLGVALSTGEGEIYASLIIEKIDFEPPTAGSGFMYEAEPKTTPRISDLTWRNQGSQSAVDGEQGLIVTLVPSSGWHVLEVDTPATPFDCYMRFDTIIQDPDANTSSMVFSVGVAAIDDVGGDMTVLHSLSQRITGDEQYDPQTRVQEGATISTFGTTTHQKHSMEQLNWLRLSSDGTTLTSYSSRDGVNWIEAGTTAIATSPGTVDKIGMAFRPDGVTATVVVQQFGFVAPEFKNNATGTNQLALIKDVPEALDLTWLNQGTSTMTDGQGGLVLSPQQDSFIHGAYDDAPSGDFLYHLNAKAVANGASEGLATYFLGGLLLHNTSNGFSLVFGMNYSHRAGDDWIRLGIVLTRWDGSEAYVSEENIYVHDTDIEWFRVTKSGTDLIFAYSLNGLDWIDFYTEALSNYIIAVDKVGLAAYANAGTDDPVLLVNYLAESPPSVKTFTPLGSLHVRDEQADTTEGGTSIAATWTARVLNTVLKNTINGAALGSNQITLSAGEYKVRATAPFYRCGRARLRLRNITDGATTLVGPSQYCANSDDGVDLAVMGEFSIAATKDFELQYYIQIAAATTGLGVGSDSGEVEVFAEVIIEKVA